jgi:hypothetical protein
MDHDAAWLAIERLVDIVELNAEVPRALGRPTWTISDHDKRWKNLAEPEHQTIKIDIESGNTLAQKEKALIMIQAEEERMRQSIHEWKNKFHARDRSIKWD